MKLANKVDVVSTTAAAEWVEPRAETRGNTDQATHARDSESGGISLGLERVRQAAWHRKRQAFAALLQEVTVGRFEMRSWNSDAVPHRVLGCAFRLLRHDPLEQQLPG